jgi:hypothetical protein
MEHCIKRSLRRKPAACNGRGYAHNGNNITLRPDSRTRGADREYPESSDMLPGQLRDPFSERSANLLRRSLYLLGCRFTFETNSPELLRLVAAAYRDLPRHRLSREVPHMRMTLLASPAGTARGNSRQRGADRTEPPPLRMLHGAGFLSGATAASSFVVLSPREHAAIAVISAQMLRFPYHTRYEMIEFAVFTLAARAQQLVSLHAACVGRGNRGILLMGPSGAGKSTVALQCLSAGFDFLSEDSVFVAPETMMATGVANFLHVRADSLRWLESSAEAARIRRSPVIQRRSGVKKFEVDLRRHPFRLAKSALEIVAVVFLSPQSAGVGGLLKPLSKTKLLKKMAAEQAYAARQKQWAVFANNASRIMAFELRRGRHPQDSAAALKSLLAKR